MATTAEKRAWLAGNGHPEVAGGKGRLSDELLAEWDDAHADYAPGAAESDFAVADDPPPPAPAASPGGPAAAEDAPAVAGSEEPPSLGRRRRGGGLRLRRPAPRAADGKGKPRRPRRSFPRVSVAPLIEETYTDLASAVPPGLAPLKRLLYAQAPVAGVVLDPVVKDTIADRVVFQPAARNYERMQAGMAFLGTPVFLMGALATAPGPVIEDGKIAVVQLADEEGRPVIDEDGEPVLVPRMSPPTVQHASAMLGLRYCVRAMATLSAGSLERVQERAAENEARDDQVDAFIGWLLGAPVGPAAEDGQRAEGAAAGLRLAGVG